MAPPGFSGGIGTCTSDQLATGINLDPLRTPRSYEAVQVYGLIKQHVDLRWDR